MLSTTRAIVLRTIAHRDRRAVLKAYTEAFGLRGYVVRSGGRSGVPPALLQPLSRLELVVDERADRDLHMLREARVEKPYLRVHGDMLRGAVLLFLQEVLLRTLQEETADAALFRFLQRTLDALDAPGPVHGLPVVFLMQYTRFLGFFPEAPRPGQDHFDPEEGRFVHPGEGGPRTLPPAVAQGLVALMELPVEEHARLTLQPHDRRELLGRLLLYHRLHVHGMGELRSPAVLHEVLH
jgi:DNA repair protein RecO (recombination protein O)